MKKTILFLSIILLANFSNAMTPLKDYTQGSIELGVSSEYFKTEENFKSGGSKENLPSGFSYQLIDLNIFSRFVLLKDLGLYASGNIGTSESKSSTEVYTNSTFNWLELGADYLILDGQMKLVADLSAILPIEKVSENMETSLNWDGAFHIRPRAILSYELNGFVPYASLGLDYRDKGLSTLATYSLGLSSSTNSDFIFGAEINGFSTVVNDNLETERERERNDIINRYNANSKKFYSINPSLIDSEIYIKYNINEWSLGAAAGLTLAGSEIASGFHAKIFLGWAFGKIDSVVNSNRARTTSDLEPKSSKSNVDNFDETVEKDLLQSVEGRYSSPSFEKGNSSEINNEVESAQKAELKGPKDYNLKLKKAKPTKKKKQ